MRRAEYILLIVVIAIAGIMLYGNNKSKQLNAVIAEKQHQIDSIQKVTDSLVVSNDSIKIELDYLNIVRDSLTAEVSKKKVKVVEYKKKKHEKISQVIYGKDSVILDILSNYEYQQLLAKSKANR